jgi:dynein heavy chain
MKNSNVLQYATVIVVCCSAIAAQPPVKPASIEMKIADNNGGCTLSSALHSQVKNEVEETFNIGVLPQLYGLYESFPASSCADIYQGHPSGYYWLNVANEPQLVYCSLNENRCCGESDGKWMRIAFLNMSDPSAQCPDGWREVQSPIRTCRRQNGININSVNYTSYGIPYSRVCGRIVAYQLGTPEGFRGYNVQNQRTLDDAYIDGISITFGDPRNHIWTFAALRNKRGVNDCPCVISGNAAPPFVSQDHFCEVGVQNAEINFSDDNPLWDGQGCAGSSSCCEFNNPLWFCKQLNQTTTDDIEIRIMGSVRGFNSLEKEDIPVQLIEIFVK